MASKKTGLGSDPLSWIRPAQNDKKQDAEIDGKKIKIVAIDAISPDPDQPRKNINKRTEDIKSLAESIKKHGFISFITVQEIGPEQFRIVAGERRFTAAKIAGFKEIPVMIITKDKEPFDYALIQLEENIQRKELTAFEESEAYLRLKQEFGLQQKQIVEQTGKSKTYISKMLKINNIAINVKKEMGQKSIPREVLFELAALDCEQQEILWKKIKEEPTIVACEKAKKFLRPLEKKTKKSNRPDPDTVLAALRKALKKDKNILFRYISPKKVDSLLKEFGQ